MNLWNKLKELNSTDYTPRWTKFMTKYIMPLVIIGCGYGYWFVGELLNSKLSEFSKINTSINKVEFHERSNNKPVETIYTDVYLTTVDGLELHKRNISEFSINQLSNNLTSDEEVEIFYDQRTKVIKELRLNNEPLISFQSELENHRRGKIVIAVFFFGFLFWYLSRMYRYRKYGTI
jgi:hypothetical protein